MLSEEEIPQDGMGTMTTSEERRMTIAKEMASLQGEVDDLRKLVNTLLTIIMEEADGVQSGAAPMPPGAPRAASQCESTFDYTERSHPQQVEPDWLPTSNESLHPHPCRRQGLLPLRRLVYWHKLRFHPRPIFLQRFTVDLPRASLRDIFLPAPWQEEANASFDPEVGPANT